MGSSCLRDLIIGRWLDRVDEVGELNRILNKEDGNIVSDNIEVALIGIAASVSFCRTSLASTGSTHNLVAKPWTSRAVSALPLDPATVEKRTKVGVFLPLEPRNEAAVMLL